MKKQLILFVSLSLILLANSQISRAENPAQVVINLLLLADDETSINQNVSMTWLAPFQREDDSSLSPTEIDHYQIRYRKNGSGSYRFLLIYPPKLNASLTLRGEPGDEYMLSIRVVDTQGLASDYTDTQSVVIE